MRSGELPARWVVRKGSPCNARHSEAHHGLHDFMEATGERWCMWCGMPYDLLGTDWSVADPATGDVLVVPDYRTAVRYASKGWHDALNPLQRNLYTMAKANKRLNDAGLFG